MEYYLVMLQEKLYFQLSVNEYLKKGWKLHGNTIIVVNAQNLCFFVQALIKEESNETKTI